MNYSLRIGGVDCALLRQHLLGDSGFEGAAIALCGRHTNADLHRLLVHRVFLIPHDACNRRSSQGIEWNTDLIVEHLEEARRLGFSVIKFHSHPMGFDRFSDQDNVSDGHLLPAIAEWVEHDVPHGSVIMLNDGRLFGRVMVGDGSYSPLESIAVVGDDLNIYRADAFDRAAAQPALASFTRRHAKAFGEATTRLLRGLKVGVVGCSGTGSIVVEQLMRLGVGDLVLVDGDVVKDINLNRIVNATIRDAEAQRPKVDVQRDAISATGLGTRVDAYPVSLFRAEAVRAIASCDVLMGCVDNAEARHLMNRIAAFYLIPYIDVGVTLEADDDGEITQVCGYIHYLQPGKSSLLSRGVLSTDQIVAEGMRRQNPQHYERLRREGYIRNVDEERPAVISVNTVLSGIAVNELLARIHRFRDEPNCDFAIHGVSISGGKFYPEREPEVPCGLLKRHVGRGDVVPLLDNPELSEMSQ